MIILTRLGGREMAVNPDLIERAEPTPDTVITMVDGHKLVVAETLPELVELIRQWRASVALRTLALTRTYQDLGLDGAEADGLYLEDTCLDDTCLEDTCLGDACESAEICEISTRTTARREALDTGPGQILRLPHRET